MEHLVYVFNQSIQAVRHTGWGTRTLQEVGKMGLRLHSVYGAYKAKKRRYPVKGWLAKIDEVAKQFIEAVG